MATPSRDDDAIASVGGRRQPDARAVGVVELLGRGTLVRRDHGEGLQAGAADHPELVTTQDSNGLRRDLEALVGGSLHGISWRMLHQIPRNTPGQDGSLDADEGGPGPDRRL